MIALCASMKPRNFHFQVLRSSAVEDSVTYRCWQLVDVQSHTHLCCQQWHSLPVSWPPAFQRHNYIFVYACTGQDTALDEHGTVPVQLCPAGRSRLLNAIWQYQGGGCIRALSQGRGCTVNLLHLVFVCRVWKLHIDCPA